MPRLVSVVVLATAAASPAADIAVKPVYFQTLPFDVLTDAAGAPWFRDRDGVRDAAGKRACGPANGRWLLADRAGRFWFAVPGDRFTPPALHYTEGGKLVDPGIQSGTAWEDAAGRVYTFDGRTVHVLAGGEWSKHTAMVPAPVDGGDAQFVQDPKGRVWVWLRVGNDLAGLWAFDGQNWTGHAVPGGVADERVRLVLPFADDWFLVAVHPEKPDAGRRPRLVPFSPSHAGQAHPFAGLPTDRMDYRGEALDGVRYFYRLDRRVVGGVEPPAYWAVTPGGAATAVEASAMTWFDSQLGGPSVTAVTAVFAKPGGRVGVRLNRDAGWLPCCRDARGRVYVRGASPQPHLARTAAYEFATHVVWPEQEKFGDVLRLTPNAPGDRVTDLFRDVAGAAFARPYGRTDTVRRWDGRGWAGTPIGPLPTPTWAGRDRLPPPELGWANFAAVGQSTAADGCTVFVRVKTRLAVGKDGDALPADAADKPDARPFYTTEAWTHRAGTWSGPRPLGELLKAERTALAAGRARPQPTPGPCPVLGDGGRLWSALDWTLTVLDADGTTHAAPIPKPKRAEVRRLTAEERARKQRLELATNAGPRPEYYPPPEPLMLATLVPLDGGVLVVVAGTPAATYRATLDAGGVTVRPVTPGLPLVFPTVHVGGGNAPLAWADRPRPPAPLDWIGMEETKWQSTDGADLFEFRSGAWVKRADLFKPLAVAGDGAVWCRPTDWATGTPRGSKLTLSRLHAGRAERFAWNYGDEQPGFGEPPAAAALLGLDDYELACVEPPKTPGGKATLRVIPSADGPGGPAVVLPDGTILFETLHGRLFAPKAK